MDACDVLIVGGGPAGSSCAWKLRNSELTTVILDKQHFPRDKVCGGWITPPVVDELAIDLQEYSRKRILQQIHGFRISRMGGRETLTDYGEPISYGIRRCEFDDYLLKRCGARVQEGTPLISMERQGDNWIVNEKIAAKIVVGAGGNFCPVARSRGVNVRGEINVAAQEIEFEMTESQQERCSIREEIPELYFCRDMKGYGWCVRKRNFLNVGLGRLDPRGLPQHVFAFVNFLKEENKVTFDLPSGMAGHSYVLYGYAKRSVARDGVLLIGDAAGLAYSQSGEGIRPAIESGLLAAEAILASNGGGAAALENSYRALLREHFEKSQKEWAFNAGKKLPTWLVGSLARFLLASRWFSRRVVLERWFLHHDEPALNRRASPGTKAS